MSGDAVAGRPRPEACGRRSTTRGGGALDLVATVWVATRRSLGERCDTRGRRRTSHQCGVAARTGTSAGRPLGGGAAVGGAAGGCARRSARSTSTASVTVTVTVKHPARGTLRYRWSAAHTDHLTGVWAVKYIKVY